MTIDTKALREDPGSGANVATVIALVEEIERLGLELRGPLKLVIVQRNAALDREDALKSQLAAVTAARDEACDWAEGIGDKNREYGLRITDQERIAELRKVGAL